MRTTQTKATPNLDQLAEDVAAANALRRSWKRGGKRQRSTRTATARKTATHPCDGDDYAACGCEPTDADAPSALINTAWLDDLATALRARARELGEWVEAWKDSDSPETLEAYRTLAHELRIAAVRAQRQSEREHAMMRDAIDRMHAARPGFALVG